MRDWHRRAVLSGAAAASLAGGSVQAKPKIGQPAPPFSVYTFDYKTIPYDQLKGQVIVLNYWATWCGPCKRELPILSTYFTHHADKGLRMFAVKDESDNRSNHDLIPLSKVVSFPLVWHLNGRGYGSIDGAVPTNYVIDRNGILRYAKAGAFEFDSLDDIVTPLLDDPVPPAAT